MVKKIISDNEKRFRDTLRGMGDVTVYYTDGGFTDASVFINHREFVSICSMDDGKPEMCYMVYINNPGGHDDEQWIFGNYKRFGDALNKAKSIVKRREYPKPVLVW